jgi:hypothetical protein
MTKVISMFLSIVLLLSVTTTILAQEENQFTYKIGNSDIEIPSVKNKANILNKIGLFQGTENGYQLEKPVTRAEAITMVLWSIPDLPNMMKAFIINLEGTCSNGKNNNVYSRI